MPIVHVATFSIAVVAVISTLTRWRAEPVLALILGAAGFGIGCGMSLGQIGKSFGNGFGAAAASTGLAVLAATLIGSMAEAGGATQCIRDWALHRRGLVTLVTPFSGLVAGIGAAPSPAFALLSPISAAAAANPIRLALAILAGQGLVLPSPVVIAATTILAADWRMVLAIGLPCAACVLIAAGALGRGHLMGVRQECAPASVGPARALPATGLIAVTVTLIALLIVQSLGNIPSEPFGGGSTRELLLGLGRPFILLLVGVGNMSVFARRSPIGALGTTAITRAAPVLLLLGAAGGLQAIAQDSRMADALAETLATTHLGLVAPFLVATCLKMLLGSSPVAAISAAGLLQPALSGLGLDDPVGHACAALAVGAGAVSGVHINDGLFWLVTEAARMRPGRGMVLVFGASLLQGALAVGLLSLLHAGFKELLF